MHHTSFCLFVALVLSTACADPVHDAAVEALGPEAPNVGPGPLHRPGQPCLTCHGGDGPGDPTFAFAGTVFGSASGDAAAPGATVAIVNGRGARVAVRANRAGNFFVQPEDIAPAFPATTSVSSGEGDIGMVTPMYRTGDCNDCHHAAPGPDSPGYVYVIPPEGAP